MEETDETQVTFKRNKKKLEEIRERANRNANSGNQDDRRYPEIASRSVQATQGTSKGDVGSVQGTGNSYGSGEEGMESGKGITRGDGEGIRSVDTENQPAAQVIDSSYGTARASKLESELTPEEKAENEKERNRQKQQRYRDRQRETSVSSESYGYSYAGNAENVTIQKPSVTDGAKFQLKSPFKISGKEPEKVKLLSKTEAEDAEESIINVLVFGTKLLDDVLEIVVKGHEAVTIWEMDRDEATLFAQAHLKRAQKEQDAARVARKLIELHDRLLTFQYLFSRTKATVTHVKSHGGFGFR